MDNAQSERFSDKSLNVFRSWVSSGAVPNSEKHNTARFLATIDALVADNERLRMAKQQKNEAINRLVVEHAKEYSNAFNRREKIQKEKLALVADKVRLEEFKKAVEDFLDDELCGGYKEPTWEKCSVKTLQSALRTVGEAGA